MSFDFTIAITPKPTSSGEQNLATELQYIKSALLYADKVRLISPIAYMFSQLTDENNQKNERTAMDLIMKCLPFAQAAGKMEFYNNSISTMNEFSKIFNNKKYNQMPFAQRLLIKKEFKNLALTINRLIIDLIGENHSAELTKLIKSKKVILEKLSMGDDMVDDNELFKLPNNCIFTELIPYLQSFIYNIKTFKNYIECSVWVYVCVWLCQQMKWLVNQMCWYCALEFKIPGIEGVNMLLLKCI